MTHTNDISLCVLVIYKHNLESKYTKYCRTGKNACIESLRATHPKNCENKKAKVPPESF